MAAVTVRSIYDLMGWWWSLPRRRQFPLVVSASAPLVGVDYPLPDFSLNFLVRGEWLEHIFLHEHLKSIQITEVKISIFSYVQPE